jgi:hypothetical protein
MEDYQKRLLQERDTVEQNAKKLEEFIYENPIYDKLSRDKQKLACQQLAFMEGYYRTLNERIKLEGI